MTTHQGPFTAALLREAEETAPPRPGPIDWKPGDPIEVSFIYAENERDAWVCGATQIEGVVTVYDDNSAYPPAGLKPGDYLRLDAWGPNIIGHTIGHVDCPNGFRWIATSAVMHVPHESAEAF